MLKHRFTQLLVTVLAIVALLGQGTGVLAGTTGGISGIVQTVDSNDKVTGTLAGATVQAVSPSQSASTTTDQTGHFTFVGLAPDSYVLTVQKQGYESTSVQGVNVFADQNQNITLETHPPLKEIGRVATRAQSSLVRPGITSDNYSISAAQTAKVAAAGGGGTLNSAFSALSTVPGVYVAGGQAGYIGAGATLSIRGGDYDQIGYEIDGVPVNRSFDNYPSGPASTLGQQELQVYTGVPPANAQSNGLSGFINQVIRTGTYPGFVTADFGLGTNAFYNKAAIEVGGATPDRNFSYYVGIDGYNQNFRYVDQFNGAGVGQLFGSALAGCGAAATVALEPSCFAPNGTPYGGSEAYYLGGPQLFNQSSVEARDNVVNLHFGLPHKNGTKDDIQLLGVVNYLNTAYYSSTNDMGGVTNLGNTDLGVPFYFDGYQFNAPTGQFLPTNYQALASQYYFPNTPQHAFQANIDPTEKDGFENDQAIYKLQYTHALGSTGYIRGYGYTYYSDWLNTAPQTDYANFGGSASPDYELSSHTRGGSISFVDQLNPQNLVNLTGSYTTATSLRSNNSENVNGVVGGTSARQQLAFLVDSSNPTNGLCYTSAAVATSCFNNTAQIATLKQAYSGTIKPAPALTCGGGPCAYYVVENGQYATYNTVQPNFYEASLSDDWHPTNKLAVNAGIRYDLFGFNLGNTQGTGARSLFYNAYNLDYCLNNATGLFVAKKGGPLATCQAGTTAANITNPSGNVQQSFVEFQPRLGFTYTIDPRTVIRGSYGRYAQAPNTAFEQYNSLQQDSPALLYNTYAFEKFGFTSPDHPVRPEVSNNYDFSIEHEFPNQISVKISPFLRTTQDEIQQFYLNQQTNFVSGLNVGRQTSEGFEFELDKGNFAQQGLSARLTFTYTNNYINYNTLSNGSTVVTSINNDIANYNAYTHDCAAGGKFAGTSTCGTTQSGNGAAACYTQAGAADPACAAGSIANPYFNANAQALVNPKSNFPTFDILTSGVGSAVDSFGAPYVGTLVLNERVGKFSIAPIIQYVGGQRYGAPETTEGVAPDTCTGVTGPATGDARYLYGPQAGSGFDYTTCGTLNAAPDPYTKTFDGIGGFVSPSQLTLHAQATYEVSNHLTIVANASNIVSTCFGGTKVPWSVSGACSYGTLAYGSAGDIGNVYNPGQLLQPYVQRPYLPYFGSGALGTTGLPFNLYLSANIKL